MSFNSVSVEILLAYYTYIFVLAFASTCSVVPGTRPRAEVVQIKTDLAFQEKVNATIELVRSSFLLTDQLISTIDGQLNGNSYSRRSNALSLTAEILQDQIASIDESEIQGEEAAIIKTESLRARELSKQRATVIVKSVASHGSTDNPFANLRISLQIRSKATFASFVIVELSQATEGKVLVHLGALDDFFDSFTEIIGESDKRFHLAGDFSVSQTSENIHVVAEKLTATGPKIRFRLQEFAIDGESFQKLTSITCVARAETATGLEAMDLKIDLSPDGSGIRNVSEITIEQIQAVIK
jgi:hypothetical protein